jgi:SSS family solute:Na+ symporter
MQSWIIVTAITAAYLLIVLVVGLRARSKESSTLEGYVAGGRHMGTVLLFFIMGAEIFSAFTFLGGPGWAYSRGAPAFYLVAYLTLGVGVMWLIAPRARRISQRLGHLTQADMLAGRFQSRWLMPLIAVISILALVPYLTIQITGAGLLFEAATDGKIPFWLGALAAFVVVTLYVYTSGLRGIGWTNFVQGVMMVGIAWFLGISVAEHFYGGVGAMFHEIAARAPQYLTLPGGGKGMHWAPFSTAILVSVLGGVMWPHIFMKFYTAGSERTLKKIFVMYPIYAYLLVPILFIGFAGILVYQDSPLHDPDNVLLSLVVKTAHFSPWVIGIMLSGALAAAMSTGANLAHTAATVAARDFIAVLRPGLGNVQVLRLTKILVVVVAAVAYALALYNPKSLVATLLAAYGVIVQLLPLALAVLFWPRANRAGAYAGLISGGIVAVLFTVGPATPLGVHPGIWGLIVNIVALVGVSLATAPMGEAHVRQFAANADDDGEQIAASVT